MQNLLIVIKFICLKKKNYSSVWNESYWLWLVIVCVFVLWLWRTTLEEDIGRIIDHTSITLFPLPILMAVLVVRIRNGNLVVLNVGDCRTMISRWGVAEALISNDKPFREDERDKIETQEWFSHLIGMILLLRLNSCFWGFDRQYV